MACDALTTKARIRPTLLRRLLLAGLLGGALVPALRRFPEQWLTFRSLRGHRERLAEHGLEAWRRRRARNAPRGSAETL